MHINKFRKYYFINKLETNNIDKLDNRTIVIYRNYNNKIPDIELILKIKRYCKKKRIKFLLSNNIKLAIQLDLDGAYIPSFNRSTFHLAFSLKKGFSIIGSAHNYQEIIIKEKQGCEEIFISPIFFNEKNKYFLDVIKFNNLALTTNRRIIALGGINQRNIKRLLCTKSTGYAGISGIKKTGLK